MKLSPICNEPPLQKCSFVRHQEQSDRSEALLAGSERELWLREDGLLEVGIVLDLRDVDGVSLDIGRSPDLKRNFYAIDISIVEHVGRLLDVCADLRQVHLHNRLDGEVRLGVEI